MKKLVEEQFSKKIEFKKDYIEEELFRSGSFKKLFMKTVRVFGGATGEEFYSLRLELVSLQAIQMILKNLKL